MSPREETSDGPQIATQENPTIGRELSLPIPEGGKDAWLFLASCFVVEALVWGLVWGQQPERHSLIKFLTYKQQAFHFRLMYFKSATSFMNPSYLHPPTLLQLAQPLLYVWLLAIKLNTCLMYFRVSGT